MENIKELRMQYGPDKAISKQQEISSSSRSLRAQASSTKRCKLQATSLKPQAASFKLQAASDKLHDS